MKHNDRCGISGLHILTSTDKAIATDNPLHNRLKLATFDNIDLQVDSSTTTDPILFNIKLTLVDSRTLSKSIEIKVGCYEVQSIIATYVQSAETAVSADAPGHLFKITVDEKKTVIFDLLKVMKTSTNLIDCPDFKNLTLCSTQECKEVLASNQDFSMIPNPAVRDDQG